MTTTKRLAPPDKRKIRNLAQYKGMTDDEFDEMYAKKTMDAEPSAEFERRIELKMKKFAEDYDLSDMKINDHESLRALIQALITLEDYEQYTYKLRGEGIDYDNLTKLDRIALQMNKLRGDISGLQESLKISRRVRKGDNEESVLNFIEDLKLKAKKFYENRMDYIFCPKCNMLLGTIWTLYPDAKNKITLTCKRELDSGELCGTIVTVSTEELKSKRGTNNKEIMPESML